MAIKFGELRKYISRVVRLSIWLYDSYYDNYIMVSDIPEGKYDDLYIFGIGMTDVEFPLDVYSEPKEFPQRISLKEGFFIGCALEVVLHDNARDIKRSNENELTFGDIRGYLQCGEYFSIVTKEGWIEENYQWRSNIPEKYNDMYVYGIGIEDNREKLLKSTSGIVDTQSVKKLRIVVSENSRG